MIFETPVVNVGDVIFPLAVVLPFKQIPLTAFVEPNALNVGLLSEVPPCCTAEFTYFHPYDVDPDEYD